MPQRSDHDLLIQIDTKLNALTQTVNEFSVRLATKADLSDLNRLERDVDHNTEIIENLQRFKWMLLGGVSVLQLGAEFLFHAVLKH